MPEQHNTVGVHKEVILICQNRKPVVSSVKDNRANKNLIAIGNESVTAV